MGVQINGSTGNVIATKGTFSGNVGIAGTLTYEDVTDIDAVGLITARSGIEVGASPGVGASISRQGNAIFSGITTIGSKEVGAGITLSPDGHVSVSGVTTSSTIHIGVDTGVYGENLVVTGTSRVTGIASFGTSNSSSMQVNIGMSTLSAAPVLTVPDMIKHSGDPETRIRFDTGIVKVETTKIERLRVGPNGQLGISGANYGTSGQVLTSQGSGSAVQWASPVVAGSILQTVYNTTTDEGQTQSSSYTSWSGLATNITPLSSSSHLWIWINAIRLNVQQDSNEGRLRVTDGTNNTEAYRCFNYDSDGNYQSFNPCLNWYWPQTHTAGTQITLTPQLRSTNGSDNVIWGDNGEESYMIIQEIAR